ncbi:MAG: YebC/PmpR family DNA-binding transcriptional regulator [Patescibacteria group bacterium]|nr:YebC/PmpR family DNA-binding transcriptional regulator [Patescibacteria group bacterium]
MSGHSKWSKIKHKKAASDAQKSKIFGKLARLVAVESKNAKGDLNAPGLRTAIEKAKAMNMPADNIDRAVKKGVGEGAEQMEHVVYEAYGPGGSALIIEGLTDNRNRTSQEIKYLLSKNGASLAAQGAASWAFEKNNGEWSPKISTPLSLEDGENLKRIIEELEDNDDVQNVFTNAE